MDYLLLFRREFWQIFFIALRRSTRDAHARQRVLKLTFAALASIFPVIYVTAVSRLSHDRNLTIFCCVIVSLELGVIIGIQWKWKRDEDRQLASDIASVDTISVQRLQKLAQGLAALNERASSELFARYKTLPEGLSINTRRIHIDTLRAKGVWDELPSRVRQWLMRPDGSWPAEVALQIRWAEEKLHTLLWALALTRELRSLERMEKPLDFAVLEKLFAKPAPGIRPTWDLRVERNKAQPYFFRLCAESIHRRQIHAQSEEQANGVEEWISAMAEGKQTDDLSGARTVAELDDDALKHVARSAACRYQVLSMLLDSLETNQRWDRFVARIFNALPHMGRVGD